MFISELIGKPVIDCFEERIGKVRDILAIFGQTFPKVTGLLVDVETERKPKILMIGDVDLVGKQLVSTKAVKDRVMFSDLRPEDILLCRDGQSRFVEVSFSRPDSR